MWLTYQINGQSKTFQKDIMSENDNDELESTNELTEEVEKTDEIEETDSESGTEDLEALQERNKRLFERAKKAEAEAKILKAERLKKEEQAKVKVESKAEPESSEKQDGLTQMDVIALSKANIHEDDIEEVVRWAKFNDIGVRDALKDKTMQTLLRDRAEERTTAEATNTGNARRGSTRPSADQILADAEKGKEVDPAEFAESRWESKRKK